jgi:MOSC domain-containing protein YiiM
MTRLLSVNVGYPGDIVWKVRTVHTGISKNPVTGRCRLGRLSLEGDGQGDLAAHGDEHRAVFVYQIESYRYWQEQLKRSDFVCGQFGENLRLKGWRMMPSASAIDFRAAPQTTPAAVVSRSGAQTLPKSKRL